ncbi:extracellular solute-binding protein [Paenibacillus sp. FA6]|uniref:extracellular solute-binding protein n=1 Tax=Paenibacillus sp. FA6 TaxID=3413029 RepID=UPI003F6576D3
MSPSLDFTQNDSRKTNNDTSKLLSVDSPNPDSDHGPIQIFVQLSDDDFNSLMRMNQRFIQETGIQSEISNFTKEMAYDEFSRSLAMGEGPDVLLIESAWVNTFATKGYLLPVESYLKRATGSHALRMLLPMVEWNGYQWATPFDMDPYVMVWQPKTLAEMGIMEVPSTKMEWAQLLSKQEDRLGKTLLGIDAGEPYALAGLMGGMGADILQPDDESLLWLEQARPYMYIISNNKQEAWKLLQDGDMPLQLSTYSEAKSSWKYGLNMELPWDFYNKSPLFLRGSSIAVSSQTLLTEQSAEWITYMTSTSNQQEWLDTTDRLPSLTAIYESESIDGKEIPFTQELLQEPSDRSTKVNQTMSPSWSELANYVNLLLTGQMTVNQFKEAMSGQVVQDSPEKQ